MKLKSCTSDLNVNSHNQDLNPAKTHGVLAEITHSFWVLMKLEFIMSYCRKNSMRDRETGKKCIYLERNTFYRQKCGSSQKT